MGISDLIIKINLMVILTLAIRANKIPLLWTPLQTSAMQLGTNLRTTIFSNSHLPLANSLNYTKHKIHHTNQPQKQPIPPEPPPSSDISSRSDSEEALLESSLHAQSLHYLWRSAVSHLSILASKIKACYIYLGSISEQSTMNQLLAHVNLLSPTTFSTKKAEFSVCVVCAHLFKIGSFSSSLLKKQTVVAPTRRSRSKYSNNSLLAQVHITYYYSLTNHSEMNAFYDTPPGFVSPRALGAPQPRPVRIVPAMLSPLEASLFLRSKFLLSTSKLRISNCPTKAIDNFCLWDYFASPCGYQMEELPFGKHDELDENAILWGGHGSTRRRPTLYSIAPGGATMTFTSCPMTRSGLHLPSFQRRGDGSTEITAFPFVTSHRINLKELFINPATGKSQKRTRLVQLQPTMVLPGEDHLWANTFYISGLGPYADCRSCVHGAVLSKLYHYLLSQDLEVYARRFQFGSQLDWTHLQYESRDGIRREQHVATLRLLLNDPTDQSEDATEYATEIRDILCSFLFGSSPDASTVSDFLGFQLRVHRHDISGSLQPLASKLRQDLDQPPPAQGLFKITLRHLSSFPCLPWIQARLHAAGVRDLVNVAYEHVEASKTPRDHKKEFQHPFLVALFFSTPAGARGMRLDTPDKMINIFMPVLASKYVKMTASCTPPIPPRKPEEPAYPLIHTALPEIGQVKNIHDHLDATEVMRALLHPAPASLPDSDANVAANSHPQTASSSGIHDRHPSPKRTREGDQPRDRDLPPASNDPDENDLELQEEIAALASMLYSRHPTDTYQFLEKLLDALGSQLLKDGHSSSRVYNTQDEMNEAAANTRLDEDDSI
jgi:hypothetical protein